MRSDILSENIYCPAEKAVLMASYQVQAKFGDYDGVDKHTSGYLANEKLLPAKILSQHKLSIQEWEEKVRPQFRIPFPTFKIAYFATNSGFRNLFSMSKNFQTEL